VWIVSLYTYHSKRIFSVFRLKPHICFICKCQLNTVIARSTFSHYGLSCRWAVPGDRQNRGWPWQPLKSIDGRVAESSRVPHISGLRIWAHISVSTGDGFWIWGPFRRMLHGPQLHHCPQPKSRSNPNKPLSVRILKSQAFPFLQISPICDSWIYKNLSCVLIHGSLSPPPPFLLWFSEDSACTNWSSFHFPYVFVKKVFRNFSCFWCKFVCYQELVSHTFHSCFCWHFFLHINSIIFMDNSYLFS
jgi:hypothetical protein